MIELKTNQLVFSFPEVHPGAQLNVDFQRTLRIPDDGRTYPLPPGMGCFSLEHVDDFEKTVPPTWLERGGVLMPMYQSEAMWINFGSNYVADHGAYPFAVKIATGKINAVTGEVWTNGLSRGPQDYVTSPKQPWLDGYCVEKGLIRQFVAMPLGEGFTAEEQLTDEAEFGGVQIIAYPMKRTAFEKHFPKRRGSAHRIRGASSSGGVFWDSGIDMGLAPGGKMRQEIYDDPFQIHEWADDSSRCFVHICNSQHWRKVTGQAPPPSPANTQAYTQAGLPWFEYYGDPAMTMEGSEKLSGLKSLANLFISKGKKKLKSNESVKPNKIIVCASDADQIRDGESW